MVSSKTKINISYGCVSAGYQALNVVAAQITQSLQRLDSNKGSENVWKASQAKDEVPFYPENGKLTDDKEHISDNESTGDESNPPSHVSSFL